MSRLNEKKIQLPFFIPSVILMILFVLSACSSDTFNQDRSTLSDLPSPQMSETNAPEISLAIGEWPPYTGETLKNYGCDAQVVAEVFRSQGVEVKFGFFPWARSYYEAQTGNWDGTFEWADTPELRKDFYISQEKLSDQEWVFFYRTTDPFNWESMLDLAGKKIGLTSGYVYSDLFTDLQNNKNYSFEEATSDLANFQKLLSGRIDIFPIEKQVGLTILQEHFSSEEINQLTIHPKSIYSFDPYLLLNKQNPENEKRIELFNQGLKELKQSGRYEEIMQECIQ